MQPTEVIEATREYRIQVRVRHRHRAGHRPAASTRTSSGSSRRRRSEPEWLLEWRLKALPRLAQDGGADTGRTSRTSRSTTRRSATTRRRRRRRSSTAWTKSIRRSARPSTSSASRSSEQKLLAGRRRRRGVRLGLGGDDVPQQAGGARHHLLLVLRSGAGPSRPREAVPRLGRAVHRQLLRDAQLRGVHRRQLRLHPEGRALPDGAVDLLPHQRARTRASSSAR